MRAPQRRRPLSRTRVPAPPGVDLGQLAERVTYVISRDHKQHFTEAGPGRLRSDATACPSDVSRDDAERWLRASIVAGDVGGAWEGQVFPEYAWFRQAGEVFEARLSNADQGWYHGYPLRPDEAPAWLA